MAADDVKLIYCVCFKKVRVIIRIIINNENMHFDGRKYKTLSLVQMHDNSFISLYIR